MDSRKVIQQFKYDKDIPRYMKHDLEEMYPCIDWKRLRLALIIDLTILACAYVYFNTTIFSY
jgi:hypothetical protein